MAKWPLFHAGRWGKANRGRCASLQPDCLEINLVRVCLLHKTLRHAAPTTLLCGLLGVGKADLHRVGVLWVQVLCPF